jgi:hypothetical protein
MVIAVVPTIITESSQFPAGNMPDDTEASRLMVQFVAFYLIQNNVSIVICSNIVAIVFDVSLTYIMRFLIKSQ